MLSCVRTRATCLRLTQLLTYSRRFLSTNETATALRPFLFAVHPDLFGRFPKAQATNEESLKRLNEHLQNLHSKRRVAPISLLFYVRNTEQDNDSPETQPEQLTPANFKAIRISLFANTLQDAVKTVLRSCNLPMSYIESLAVAPPTTRLAQPDRPIKWHHSYYNLYRVPNPETQEIRKKAEITLSTWLQKNLGRARTKLAAQEPLKLQTQRLVEEVKEQTGLVEIHWKSSWGTSQFRACLKSFSRLYEENKLDINLTGQTLVFAGDTGVCVRGHIILRHDDVADHWLWILLTRPKHDVIHNKLPAAEKHLSTLLNDINIVRKVQHPIVLAETYLGELRKLCHAIKAFQKNNPGKTVAGDLSDVDMVIAGPTSSLMVSVEGQIIIPSSCPAFLLIDFIKKYANKAREVKQEYERSDQLESQLIQECLDTLRLKSLTKDQNITSLQMEACCVRLLEESRHAQLGLEGCHLKVAEFYSVMSDGEMFIPWKWKSCKSEDQ